MFADPVALADAGAVNKSFYANSFGGNSVSRIERARTPDQPRTMTVSHETSGKGTDRVARRMVKFTSTDKDANGVYHTCSMHVVITVPAQFDGETVVKDLAAFVKNFLTTANVEALLDGEV